MTNNIEIDSRPSHHNVIAQMVSPWNKVRISELQVNSTVSGEIVDGSVVQFHAVVEGALAAVVAVLSACSHVDGVRAMMRVLSETAVGADDPTAASDQLTSGPPSAACQCGSMQLHKDSRPSGCHYPGPTRQRTAQLEVRRPFLQRCGAWVHREGRCLG